MSSRLRKVNELYPTLKAWRDAHGYTLQQAADILGEPLTSYYMWESGVRHPKPKTLRRIYERTGVSLAFLAGVA